MIKNKKVLHTRRRILKRQDYLAALVNSVRIPNKDDFFNENEDKPIRNIWKLKKYLSSSIEVQQGVFNEIKYPPTAT